MVMDISERRLVILRYGCSEKTSAGSYMPRKINFIVVEWLLHDIGEIAHSERPIYYPDAR
jgi:hypothetical protein